jgi:hypothetical protein
VTAAGYPTGLYSSDSTGIANVRAVKAARPFGFVPPEKLYWFA